MKNIDIKKPIMNCAIKELGGWHWWFDNSLKMQRKAGDMIYYGIRQPILIKGLHG